MATTDLSSAAQARKIDYAGGVDANTAILERLGVVSGPHSKEASHLMVYGTLPEVAHPWPFPDYYTYSTTMRRWRRLKKNPPRTIQEAKEFLKQDTDKRVSKLSDNLDSLARETRFDAQVQNMLAIGVACGVAGAVAGGAIGAAIGSGFFGVGAVIGAAVGAIVGFVFSIFPFEKVDFLDRWRSFIHALEPIERYALMANIKAAMDHATDNEHLPRYQGLRLGNNDFHSLAMGTDVMVMFCIEDMFKQDWAPVEYPLDHAVTRYCLAQGAARIPDNEPLRNSYLYGIVDGPDNGSPWLKAKYNAMKDVTAGTIRANAMSIGINDITKAPTPPEIVTLIENRQREAQARGIQQGGK